MPVCNDKYHDHYNKHNVHKYHYHYHKYNFDHVHHDQIHNIHNGKCSTTIRANAVASYSCLLHAYGKMMVCDEKPVQPQEDVMPDVISSG